MRDHLDRRRTNGIDLWACRHIVFRSTTDRAQHPAASELPSGVSSSPAGGKESRHEHDHDPGRQSDLYKDWGKGQPIVFSHGWPLSADDWDGQMLYFLAHYIARHGSKRVAKAVLMSAKLVKNAKLKVYPGYPHGMCATNPDVINPDLLAFFKS